MLRCGQNAVATRVFHDPATSFHPKAYLFSSADGTVAATFVGSNNLSAAGIAGGIEWAIGADRAAPLLTAFERLWSDPRSQPLIHGLLADYRRRWQPAVHTAGVVPEPPATPPAPRPIQQEALAALVYTGNFAKIALNVAHRAGQPGNVLADLLRSWFGTDAGQPGTVQYVELVGGESHWQMRPASAVASHTEPAWPRSIDPGPAS